LFSEFVSFGSANSKYLFLTNSFAASTSLSAPEQKQDYKQRFYSLFELPSNSGYVYRRGLLARRSGNRSVLLRNRIIDALEK